MFSVLTLILWGDEQSQQGFLSSVMCGIKSKHNKTEIKVITKCQEFLVHILKNIGWKQATWIQNFRFFRQIFLFMVFNKYIKENLMQSSI